MNEPPEETAEDHFRVYGLSAGRIAGFSDGVFAVAITLLILNIKVPIMPKKIASQRLPHELAALWPYFMAFILSFVIIGAFWIFHHRMLSQIKRINVAFLWLNLLLLMCIVFMPFSTSLISEYGNSVSVTFYAASWFVTSLVFAFIWWYASSKKRLVAKDFDLEDSKHAIMSFVVTSLVFAVSIIISIFSAAAAMYFWLLLIPIHRLLGRQHVKRKRSAIPG